MGGDDGNSNDIYDSNGDVDAYDVDAYDDNTLR